MVYLLISDLLGLKEAMGKKIIKFIVFINTILTVLEAVVISWDYSYQFNVVSQYSNQNLQTGILGAGTLLTFLTYGVIYWDLRDYLSRKEAVRALITPGESLL